jgi:hypothetical protein
MLRERTHQGDGGTDECPDLEGLPGKKRWTVSRLPLPGTRRTRVSSLSSGSVSSLSTRNLSSSNTVALSFSSDLSAVYIYHMSSTFDLPALSTVGLPAAGDLPYLPVVRLPALQDPDLRSLQIVSGSYHSGFRFFNNYFVDHDNDIDNGFVSLSMCVCVYTGPIGHLQ